MTAQKRAESVQDVPITMQAFGGSELRDRNIDKATDIVKLAPNLNISTQHPANQQINIRGVGTNDFFGNSTGSVGVYMDEVTMSSPYLSGLGLYDMERVEILRGPQNSLFGRNTTGGAVNYISRAPVVGGGTDGFFNVSYGNFDSIDLEGAGTLQLGNNMALRVAGKSFDRGGIWNNIDTGEKYGKKNRMSARATLAWEPGTNTRITFNLHWAGQDSEIDPYLFAGTRATDQGLDANGNPIPDGTASFNPAFAGLSVIGTDPHDFFSKQVGFVNGQGFDNSFANFRDITIGGSTRNDIDTYGGYIKIEHDFGWAAFTSITSYDDSEIQFTNDAGGSANNIPSPLSGMPESNLVIDQDQSVEQFSQEIRLTSPSDDRFRWIAGLYYFHEDSELSQNIRFGTAQIVDLDGMGTFGIAGGGTIFGLLFQGIGIGVPPGTIPNAGFDRSIAFSIADLENDVISPYARLEFDITDRLTLTGGIRFTDDTKKMPLKEVGVLRTFNVINGMEVPIDVRQFWSAEFVREQVAIQGVPAECAPGVVSPGNLTPCATASGRPNLNFSEVGGRIGLDFHVNDDILVYGHYSRGFRSGKQDIEFFHGPHGLAEEPLGVETLDAFEVGFKTTLLGNRLQFNGAGFFNIWNDQQNFFVGAAGPTFTNIPKAEIIGLEFEGALALTPTTRVQAAVGFMDSEITKVSRDEDGNVVGAAQLGHELPFAANFSFNGRVVQDFNIGSNVFSVQADLTHRSSPKAFLFDAGAVDELGSRTEISLRGTYNFGDNLQYRLSVFGENLTQDRHCSFKTGLAAPSGTINCGINEAQAFWGVEAGLSFN